MATQRSRQTWQTSSLLNVSTNSLPKSKASVKRSVTPNSRAHNAGDATDKAAAVAVKQRSVTPVSRSFSNGESEKQTSGVVKVPASKRAVTPLGRVPSIIARDPEPGRVRVAVRLRPRNAEDLASDADFADCVELQPELKKLNLRKNNWNSESYKFDEVFTETASQKRVYQVVTKPVVESVLSGYNGTIMAYGQTGTGKTYTVGNMGKIDESERGIVVRAVEDILSNTSPPNDSVEVSYLQLYMESVQDLLAPEKVNIPIIEDPKSGEVSVPGAEVVKIQDIDDFMELLRMGETNRHAANTKMNTNSSRSHAVLMVHIKRSVVGRTETAATSHERVTGSNGQVGNEVRMIRKSKLLIVDLAGSERIDKSGSEGQLLEEAKFINLSLTTLGKCINALAENSAHIPTRESKLTRLLRDSFGGSARTSLIITIGPSARHHAETTSTIMFGQRAMKVVNMMKVKEEFDYESLSRKLESQVDHLTKEIDRQRKLRDNYINQMEKKLKECQHSFAEAEKSLVARSEMLEKENARLEMEIKALQDESEYQKDCNKLLCDQVARLEMSLEHFKQKQQDSTTYQKALADTNQMHENQIAELIEQLEDERARCEGAEKQTHSQKELLRDHENLILQYQEENSRYQKELSETKQTYEKQIMQLLKQLEDEHSRCVDTEEQVHSLKKLLGERNSDQKVLSETMEMYEKQIAELTTKLQDEHAEREHAEEQVDSLKKVLSDQNSVQNQEKSEGNDLKIKVEGMERTHHATLAELQSLKEEYATLLSEKEKISGELDTVKDKLLKEEKQRITLENELVRLEKLAHENNEDVGEKKSYMKPHSRGSSSFKAALGLNRSISVQRAGVAKIFEEAGLEKILSLLSSEDVDIQMHALKVVANLAAEDGNQEKIVNDGGLDALLMLLQTSQNTTILRVASGAVANLAMNENNQGLIMSKGGAQLLASTASKTEDPQTLRMVAGAIANLCGNVNLHTTLKQDGGLKALLGMARIGNADVIAQVARGLANFAKCETREVVQGRRKGRSLLMEDGAFAWLIVNSETTSDSTRRHIELALCHLAQNEDNARDFIATGGLKEVMRISNESVREDIRNLAKKTLKLNPSFQAQFPTNR